LNNLKVDDPSGLNINHVEDVCRSISLMAPVAIDPDDG
jgi:hypothetical protein